MIVSKKSVIAKLPVWGFVYLEELFLGEGW
jgi:hypothetical protein